MTNRRRLRDVSILTTVVLTLSLAACREVNGTLYSQYADISPEGWQRNEILCFDPYPADSVWTGSDVTLDLNLRYSSDTPMANLPVLVTVEDSERELRADTLRIVLFDTNGNPVTAKHYGICEYTVRLIDKTPLRPGLSVCLVPLAPQDASRGLLNVGITLSTYGSDSASLR